MTRKDSEIVTEMVYILGELDRLLSELSSPFVKKLQEAAGDIFLSREALRKYCDTLVNVQMNAEEDIHLFELSEPSVPSQREGKKTCPKCAQILEIATTIEPATQPDHIIIASHYMCQACGYTDREEVSLPKEIALHQHNFEELMKGV